VLDRDGGWCWHCEEFFHKDDLEEWLYDEDDEEDYDDYEDYEE